MSRNIQIGLASALVVLGALFAPAKGLAAPTQITDCADDTELRAAVADGGDYTFQCSGQITLSSGAPLVVNSSVTLDATGQSVRLVVNNPSPAGHVFEVSGGTLELVNLWLSSFKVLSSAAVGSNGTPGTDGAQGDDVACEAGNNGGSAGTGGNGTLPLDNATDGADGGDLLGGAIFMGSGTTVNLYGGKLSGSLSAGIGGPGGSGGKGGSGGRGGSPEGKTDCNFDIHGGKGGEATDGADGADGGDGGDVKGGGVFVSPTATLNVSGTQFDSITIKGGPGGTGGSGGEGGWAGRGGTGCGWITCSPSFEWYGPPGDYSGTGGDAGKGGAAGVAKGGAIYSEGTVNLTDAKFSNVQAYSQAGGDGGAGGEGGSGHGNVDAPAGDGGDAGNGGAAGVSHGGGVYSSGTLNVYSAEFDHATAGFGPTYGGNNGGAGGYGGQAPPPRTGQAQAPVGGHGGNGAPGGDAIGGSIFGVIDYRGCANFASDATKGGAGGTAGLGGQGLGAGSIGGAAGSPGVQGLSGQVDPVGFAPYPCPAGPPAEGPPGSPACKDGVDNDNDKLIDDADPGCQASDQGGSPNGSDSSNSSADKGAPKASLLGPKGQKLGKDVSIKIACTDEACTATAGGDVNVPKTAGSAKRTKLKPVTKSIPKGGKATLRLKIEKRLAKKIKKALRARKKVVANIEVTVTDAAGNKRTLQKKIRLKP